MALSASRLLRSAASASGVKNKLLLTLCSPSESLYVRRPIESVTLPGTEGAFTVGNNHSQTVAQLRGGVVTVREEGKDATTYFLSDGFCFYKSPADDSGCCTAEVVGIEIVPTDALDKDKAAQVMAEVSGSAKDSDWDKARVVLGQELCANIIRAAP